MVELSNVDLEEAAKKYNIPLAGVYSKDLLPHKLQKGFGYIINLENSVDSQGGQLPGTHWCAIYCSTNMGLYFDPFGFPPPIQVENSLKNTYPSRPYYMNATEIQSIRTSVCGYYCIYFIWYMNRYKQRILEPKKRFQKLVDEFNDTSPSKNREILEKNLKRIKTFDNNNK